MSDWARQNGIDNMTDAFYDFTDTVIWDPEYLKLVEEAVGEDIYDPWNYAMASWWQLRVNRVLDGLDPNTEEGWDGGSFLPFTIGSFEDAGDSTQKRANFRAVDGTFEWYFDKENGYASYPKEHQSAGLFFAPREESSTTRATTSQSITSARARRRTLTIACLRSWTPSLTRRWRASGTSGRRKSENSTTPHLPGGQETPERRKRRKHGGVQDRPLCLPRWCVGTG